MPYANTPEGRAKQLATSAAWYAANQEKVRAKRARWKAANPEKYRATIERWRKAHPEAVAEQHRRTTARYPEKATRRVAVIRAIQSGELIRQPCEICGSTTAIQGHHAFGYSEDMKLAVWWLCPPHHGGMHAAIRGV